MRLHRLTLQNFRNISLTQLALTGRLQFFVGANGQGKTNLLEAVGCLTALRSFRTADQKLLIAHGQPEAAIACTLEHERYGETTVTIKLRADGKEAWTDKERVTRLADYLGHFPTVVFTSQDLQLIRGAPAARRRWLDLTLAAMDADYLRVLQTYHRALAERNALLKRGLALGVAASDAGAAAELAAFEQTMAPAAAELVARRCDGLRALADVLTQRYTQIAAAAEPAGFAYAPDFAEASPAAVAAMLAKNRARDAQFRTTLCGPHRDDFEFTLAGHPAKDFASEGQQRSLVIALRLAQAAWFQARSGVRPVLLADDVLGEIDPARRERFWAAIDPEAQVLATGTALPAGTRASAWEVFYVNGGAFAPADPGA
jgi:DNA replication and repair protein RecF